MPLRERQEIQEMLRRLTGGPASRLARCPPAHNRISFRSKRTQSEKNRPTRGQQSRPVTKSLWRSNEERYIRTRG